MKLVLALGLLALLLTPALASAAAVPAMPAYRWGEELRVLNPAPVTAGGYTLAGQVPVIAPGVVAAGAYAVLANSVGVERSRAPAGPYQVFLPLLSK